MIAYYFETDVKIALARNAERAGKAKVPEKGIWATRAKLKKPTFEEGFDKIFKVRSEGDEYLIEELKLYTVVHSTLLIDSKILEVYVKK